MTRTSLLEKEASRIASHCASFSNQRLREDSTWRCTVLLKTRSLSVYSILYSEFVYWLKFGRTSLIAASLNNQHVWFDCYVTTLRLLEREPELLPLVRRVLYMAPHWQPVLDELDGISRGVPAAVAAAAAANPSSASSLLLATFAPNAHTNAHSPPQLQSTQMQRRSRQFLEQ